MLKEIAVTGHTDAKGRNGFFKPSRIRLWDSDRVYFDIASSRFGKSSPIYVELSVETTREFARELIEAANRAENIVLHKNRFGCAHCNHHDSPVCPDKDGGKICPQWDIASEYQIDGKEAEVLSSISMVDVVDIAEKMGIEPKLITEDMVRRCRKYLENGNEDWWDLPIRMALHEFFPESDEYGQGDEDEDEAETPDCSPAGEPDTQARAERFAEGLSDK